ncbi:hypothetical protein Pmani_019619 [Petrolisthes manimaculis]|uniref:Uncharacterized protein n=1 Tax=Petrolisthes manimaculis TaxID=1843537 RepID=A0AAE1U775_9EUCA|nr:hypothetical protein Pmani_019619 [Petrolisthes manimaculis]
MTKHDDPRSRKVLWRPGEGTSVVPGPNMYRNFTHISRTVHLFEALDVCVRGRMVSNPVNALCSIKKSVLHRQNGHPCRNIQVLWFGAKIDDDDVDTHDWYGNVEFSIPVSTLLERWKNYYLVEMLTAPTHSATRILVTNTCYDGVLPRYDPWKRGGSWQVIRRGTSRVLTDCRRYNSQGNNRHGHTLEFMIEATQVGLGKILDASTLSFRNHEDAVDTNRPHVCHRFMQSRGEFCPVPFTRERGSAEFFFEHANLNSRSRIAKPNLSPSAERFRRCFLNMHPPLRQPVVTPNHMALDCNPLQPHPNFPYNLLAGMQSVQLHFINNGTTVERIIKEFASPTQHMRTVNDRVWTQNKYQDEEEDVGGGGGGVRRDRRHIHHNNISGQVMPPPTHTHHYENIMPPPSPTDVHLPPAVPPPNLAVPPPRLVYPDPPVAMSVESSPAAVPFPPLLHDYSRPPPPSFFPSPFLHSPQITPGGIYYPPPSMTVPDAFQHSWGLL